MSLSGVLTFGLADIAGAAFSLPLFSLFIAVIVAGGIAIVASRPRDVADAAGSSPRSTGLPAGSGYRAVRIALTTAAIVVIVVFGVENVLRGYVLDLYGITAWWRFATPVFAAGLALAVIAAVAARSAARPVVPVVTGERRTWRTFVPRATLIGGAVALAAVLVTTIAAGLVAYVGSNGESAWLEIPINNAPEIDPVRLNFYGWTFGIPVLICAALLVAATGALLHLTAARPYIRPETVVVERQERRAAARDAVRIATAGLLLALAGAWRLIASAGGVSGLTIDGQNDGAMFEVMWRHSELALAAGRCAPVLEVVAFVLLLLVIGQAGRAKATRSSDRAEAASEAEVAR
ncbi:MAG: hypothetical protein P0Y60_01840 [Candidatus Microbacterium colombiense]|nr:MAG: hypothetical protein P0Y60_01840 [Microbacterium sp.]